MTPTCRWCDQPAVTVALVRRGTPPPDGNHVKDRSYLEIVRACVKHRRRLP